MNEIIAGKVRDERGEIAGNEVRVIGKTETKGGCMYYCGEQYNKGGYLDSRRRKVLKVGLLQFNL